MTVGQSLAVIVPVPGNELDAVLAVGSGQHGSVEICQHPVAIFQTTGLQRRGLLHLPHILGGGADNLVGFVLCGNILRGGDIVAAVGDTTNLVYLTDGVVIQPDSKSAADARLDSEAFTPKSDGGFLEVSFPFLWTDAHLIFLLLGCALFDFVWK